MFGHFSTLFTKLLRLVIRVMQKIMDKKVSIIVMIRKTITSPLMLILPKYDTG